MKGSAGGKDARDVAWLKRARPKPVQPCRIARTGKLVGPSLYHLLEVLGRERVLKRLERATKLIARTEPVLHPQETP